MDEFSQLGREHIELLPERPATMPMGPVIVKVNQAATRVCFSQFDGLFVEVLD